MRTHMPTCVCVCHPQQQAPQAAAHLQVRCLHKAGALRGDTHMHRLTAQPCTHSLTLRCLSRCMLTACRVPGLNCDVKPTPPSPALVPPCPTATSMQPFRTSCCAHRGQQHPQSRPWSHPQRPGLNSAVVPRCPQAAWRGQPAAPAEGSSISQAVGTVSTTQLR